MSDRSLNAGGAGGAVSVPALLAGAGVPAPDARGAKVETRGAKVRADVTALLKSRHTFLWVTTPEESRAERGIFEGAADAVYRTFVWDCEQGITNADGSLVEKIQDPAQALAWLAATTGRVVLVMRDLHAWARESDPSLLRSLRNAHRRMQGLPKSSARAVIALTPSGEIPRDLRGCATVIDWPLPDRAEVSKLLSDTLGALAEGTPAKLLEGEAFDAAVDAAVGLSASEAENCYSFSLVTEKAINASKVGQEKRRIVSRVPGLSFYDPEPRGLAAIGGLDNLKGWIVERGTAFSARARAYGLRTPRGMLVVGVSGTGKSYCARCVAAAWNCPLIRLDLGALKGKFVGDSEGNIRRALQLIEALGRCIVWIDEIEKALAGSTGPQGDGGVAADALGTILSWMQERTSEAFVIATANDVRGLPPELLRKGRFDEVWFVDLPTMTERDAIVRAALDEYKRDASGIDVRAVAEVTDGFVGAELAALVPDAMFRAFADGERAIATDDLVYVARQVVPLSKTSADKVNDLRTWAKGRARLASFPETTSTSGSPRALDI